MNHSEGGVAEPAWLPDGSAIAVTVRRRALAGEPDELLEERREVVHDLLIGGREIVETLVQESGGAAP